MRLVEQVAVALYGEFAADSEPCMELARRACEAVATWLESMDAHTAACKRLGGYDETIYLDFWNVQRALAAAVRGGDRPCPDAKEKKDDGVA